MSSASSSKSIIYAVSNEEHDELSTPEIRVDTVSSSMHPPPPLPPRSRNNSAIMGADSPQRNELIRRSVPITKLNNRQAKTRDPSANASQRGWFY